MDGISWWRTSFGEAEIRKLEDSVSREYISQGPVTAQFEAQVAEALDVPYAVATTSGSVSLLMAFMALGIGRGDEVIVPNRTWIATAHAALLLGAKVVLVDVRPDIPVMDVSQVQERITSRTRAIVPVHLNGRAVDMEAVQGIAGEFGLAVIEDACQALFSRDHRGYLGTQSDIGCFSLGMTKLISTGQGGFAVTRSREVYERLKLVRNHGVTDIFTDTWNQIGFNFKFTDLLASFGVVQLSRASDRIAHLLAVYDKYAALVAELPFLKLVPVKVSEGEIPLYIEVLCREKKRLVAFLYARGIQTRPVPPDLHISPSIGTGDDYPNSRVFSSQGLYLPCGPEQSLENIDCVRDALRVYAKARTEREGD